MKWTVEQWHKRFLQQASWTSSLRRYLYAQVGLNSNARVLDVGCGTGALSPDFAVLPGVTLHGLDFDFSRLSMAHALDPGSLYSCADAHFLPFADNSFDFTLCHYLLLWLQDPLIVLKEMVRVTRPGGRLLALAEPDHTARIDAPPVLVELGRLQTRSLQLQGANPCIGRSLPELFSSAGLTEIQFGSSAFQVRVGEISADWELEWQMLEQDLLQTLSKPDLDRYKALDWSAWLEGSRVLWVPTFYALGTKSVNFSVITH